MNLFRNIEKKSLKKVKVKLPFCELCKKTFVLDLVLNNEIFMKTTTLFYVFKDNM